MNTIIKLAAVGLFLIINSFVAAPGGSKYGLGRNLDKAGRRSAGGLVVLSPASHSTAHHSPTHRSPGASRASVVVESVTPRTDPGDTTHQSHGSDGSSVSTHATLHPTKTSTQAKGKFEEAASSSRQSTSRRSSRRSRKVPDDEKTQTLQRQARAKAKKLSDENGELKRQLADHEPEAATADRSGAAARGSTATETPGVTALYAPDTKVRFNDEEMTMAELLKRRTTEHTEREKAPEKPALYTDPYKTVTMPDGTTHGVSEIFTTPSSTRPAGATDKYDPTKQVKLDGKKEISMTELYNRVQTQSALSAEDYAKLPSADRIHANTEVLLDGQKVRVKEILSNTPERDGRLKRFRQAVTPQTWQSGTVATAALAGLGAAGLAAYDTVEGKEDHTDQIKMNDRLQALEAKP